MTTNTTNSAYRTAYAQQRKQTGTSLDGSLQLGSRNIGGVVTEILGGDSFQLYFLSKAFSLVVALTFGYHT